MSHQPGKFIDKRGQNKGKAPIIGDGKPPGAFFAEDFVPARGYALIECRFIQVPPSTGVHIPDQVHEEQQFAIVRAVGAGKFFSNGEELPPEWEVGDYVYAAVAQGRRIEMAGKKMVVLGTEWIFGKFPNPPTWALEKKPEEPAAEATPDTIASNGTEAPAGDPTDVL